MIFVNLDELSINPDLQIHYSWYRHQDLRHTNVEMAANLGGNF